MENLLPSFSLPSIIEKALHMKLIEAENWARVNHEKVDIFKNVKIASDYDYMDKAYAFIKKYCPDILTKCGSTKKSNTKSADTREKGNKCFQKKKWKDALKLYSYSVALAENRGTELAFAYGNRSALLFHRGYYKECLEDIDRALQLNYPESKQPQLTLRQQNAKELLPTQKKTLASTVPPPLESKNTKLRGASESIIQAENEEYGRFIQAGSDIKSGEVIVIEDPFVIFVLPEYKTTHCGECGRLCYNLIPCKKCCLEMYCSEKCRDDAYKSYHEYECILMDYYPEEMFEVLDKEDNYVQMVKQNKTFTNQICLRITLKGLRNYQDSFVDDSEDLYNLIGQMETNKSKLSKSAIMILAISCAKLYHLLKKHTNLLSKFTFKYKEDIIKYHLLRNRLICCFNLQSLVYRPSKDSDSQLLIGVAMYPTGALFNHSCAENVIAGFYGNTMVMRAIKPIKSGEQCFINYRNPYMDHPKVLRLDELRMHYVFTCKCDACINDWPTIDESKFDEYVFIKYNMMRSLIHQAPHPTELVLKDLLKECESLLYRPVKGVEPPCIESVFYYKLVCMLFTSMYQGEKF